METDGTSRAWDKVIEIISKETKEDELAVKKLLAPMKTKPRARISCTNPELVHALAVELAADRQLQILRAGSSENSQAIEDDFFFKGSCTK